MNRIWEEKIKEAYLGRNRDILEATGHLQCEASELAELLLKKKWYGKEYTREQLLSEAGDILNFLTFILHEHGYILESAMNDNLTKLKERGWIE